MYEGGMKELETIDNFLDWNSRPPFHYLRNLFNLVLMSLGNADTTVQYTPFNNRDAQHLNAEIYRQHAAEPVFVNVDRPKESIPRNRFRQPM
jgi:hypothetical protein